MAGVSVGSLYQYFPNKEALVAEVRARFGARFRSVLLALLGSLSGLSVREAIRAWVTTLVSLHAESPGVHNANSYDVWTRGNDGQDGGEDLAADIGNWQPPSGDGQATAVR